ncbi:MAG: 50S ribosomal protein L29 [Candidatus Gottesmanbacteria bacterium]
MKLKDKQHIASLSSVELTSQLSDVKKQITEVELNKYTKPVKNTRLITALREKSAVIQTKMNELMDKTTKEK